MKIISIETGIDYKSVYSEYAIAQIRTILENAYRDQYEIACKSSSLQWESKFKAAFEAVCEDIADLDLLF